MAVPSYASSGVVAVATTGISIDVPYPSGIVAGSLLILSGGSSGGGLPSTPSGWTIIARERIATKVVCAVYFKLATGSESGDLTWQIENNDVVKMARMHRYTDADSVEAAAGSSAASKTIDHPSITTTDTDRKVLSFTAINDGETAASFTGETGGDFFLQLQDLTEEGTDHGLSLQHANLPTVNTIAGGTWTYGGATEEWATVAFAIYQSDTSDQDAANLFPHQFPQFPKHAIVGY